VNRRLVWGLLGLVLAGALFVGSQGRSGPPTEDQRVQRISSVVRCPTCRGLSAAQSDAPPTDLVTDGLRRRVQEGETDTQIKEYMVSRYGEDILLQPRSALVWILPVVGVATAVGGLVFVLRRRRTRPTPKISDADQALVDEALAQGKR